MIDFLIEKFHDARFMAMLLAAIAASVTAYTLITPLLVGENLSKRMKAVASERERIRQRERDRLNRSEKVTLRQAPRQLVQKAVTDFNLGKWVAQEAAREKLVMAGYRGPAPYTTFLFFRMVTPIAFFLASAFYMFILAKTQQSAMVKLAICIGMTYLGMQAPMIFLKNAISKRRQSIKRAFPDTLDLLLICVESGMSIEAAFRRVSQEIGSQSIALAEELTLTTAELSYLQDRKVAYENLSKRIGLDGVKSVALALQQAERYGTPLGQTLRVLAQENRDMRMNEAEKKAAADVYKRQRPSRALRHARRTGASNDGEGEPRNPPVGSRAEGCRLAAEADGADDPVFSAGAFRGDPGTDGHEGLGLHALTRTQSGGFHDLRTPALIRAAARTAHQERYEPAPVSFCAPRRGASPRLSIWRR